MRFLFFLRKEKGDDESRLKTTKCSFPFTTGNMAGRKKVNFGLKENNKSYEREEDDDDVDVEVDIGDFSL